MGDPLVFDMICYFGIMLFSFSFMFAKLKDAASKWNRFQLGLPVKRSDVIKADYLGLLVMLAAGIVITAILITPGIIINNFSADIVIESVLIMVPFSIGSSLLASGLYYPALYAVGKNKEEAFLIICLIFSAFTVGFFMEFVTPEDMLIFGAAIAIAVPAILFGISYIITQKIYARKDI
jgi:hypothetical protein